MPGAGGADAAGRLRALRPALFAAGAISLVALVVHGREALGAILADTRWGLLAISVALAMAANLATAPSFRALLAKHGQQVSQADAARMFLYGQVAKYVPGKIWGLVYQAAHLSVSLPSLRVVFLANVDLMAVAIIANAAIAAGLIAWLAEPALAGASIALGLAAVLAVYASTVLARLAALAGRLAPRLGAGGPAMRDARGAAGVALGYGAMWLLYLPAAVLMLEATIGEGVETAATIVAYMNVAWIVSALVFVFPAGIGVREVVFVWLAERTGVQPSLEVAAAVAVAYRFWQIAQDAAGAVVLWLLDRAFRPRVRD